jgi:cell pole-organizing protein PopZ
MSPKIDASVAASFQELSQAMLAGNSRKLDEVVEDLLRPMLRQWLEGNLPQMVERLVREEIERVSRGRP